ncbi:MAG: TrmH family RNA methyltransferase [Thermoanaerobaculaceae bacterium]|jgi:TrmH family RNA methyltransferase
MRIRVVLVRPRYAGNIGAAVRVTANFGVPELVLVNPSCAIEDDPEFVRMAMGGERMLTLGSVSTLDAAVADVDVAIATTSTRNRDPRALHAPAELRERLRATAVESAALVFGPERGGLSRDEMRQCHMTVAVPTNPGFPVLNLAQAVGIVLALLDAPRFDLPVPADPMDRPAPHEEFRAALVHLEEVLLASGYLDPQNPARVTDQFRRWLGRTVPTRRELALLHALAAHVTYLLGRSRAGN